MWAQHWATNFPHTGGQTIRMDDWFMFLCLLREDANADLLPTCRQAGQTPSPNVSVELHEQQATQCDSPHGNTKSPTMNVLLLSGSTVVAFL